MDPSVKLLAVVCDPSRRIVSHFSMFQRKGKADKSDERSQEEKFDAAVLDAKGNVKSDSLLVGRGLYAEQIREWLKYFQRSVGVFWWICGL